MMLLLALLVVAGFAFHVMTPAERVRLGGAALHVVRRLAAGVSARREQAGPFHDALRARTPWVVATPVLAVLNAAIFLRMAAGSGAFADPQTLTAWGASFGPLTTSGEWSRLLTATFVHTGALHLLAGMAALVPLGIVLERLLGPVAFAAVYCAAGVFASLAMLGTDPMAVWAGPAGALFGLYGLLAASAGRSLWGWFRRVSSPREPEEGGEPREVKVLTIPLSAMTFIAPGAGLILLHSASAGALAPNLAGLATGVVTGLILARPAGERKPAGAQVAAVLGGAAVAIAASIVLVPRVTDVRPEIAQVVAFEDRSAGAYEKAVAQFRSGRLTAERLAEHIERTIIPDLRGIRARLKALTGVPPAHQALVASAEEYLRLRDESWRLRAEGLQKRNMTTLRRAEGPERAALEAFHRIAPPAAK